MEDKTSKKDKAIIECIKEYMKQCPYLNELSKINVDYLNMGDNDFEYWSLEKVEAPTILKKNVLGTKTERQCQFIIASRSFFNPLVDTQNIESLNLFEKIEEWFFQNTKKGILPILNEGETATSIEATSPGYLYGTNKENTLARYQMSCKLLYEKKEGNIYGIKSITR